MKTNSKMATATATTTTGGTFGHAFLANCQLLFGGCFPTSAATITATTIVCLLYPSPQPRPSWLWTKAYLCALAAKYGAQFLCLLIYCSLPKKSKRKENRRHLNWVGGTQETRSKKERRWLCTTEQQTKCNTIFLHISDNYISLC